jgi:hypothetical protein
VFLCIQSGALPDGRAISDVVKTVAFPGLGTGVGRMGPNTCAYQVRAAIDDVLLGRARFPASWLQAENRHVDLFGGGHRSVRME